MPLPTVADFTRRPAFTATKPARRKDFFSGPNGICRRSANRGAKRRRRCRFFSCPVSNPWGLVNNRREAADGTDLNRASIRDSDPPIGALKKVLAGRRFYLALTLHEDDDANGLYLYEMSEQRMDDLGETLLAAAPALGFPIDSRGTVETLRFTKRGLVRRCQRTALAKFDSRPRLIPCSLINRTRHSLTIETPSEFSLAARARMQAQLIEICVERLFITRRRRCCH